MATLPREEIASKAAAIELCVTGRIDDAGFQMARVLARSVAEEQTHVTVTSKALVETEWAQWLRETLPVRCVLPASFPLTGLWGGGVGGVRRLIWVVSSAVVLLLLLLLLCCCRSAAVVVRRLWVSPYPPPRPLRWCRCVAATERTCVYALLGWRLVAVSCCFLLML